MPEPCRNGKKTKSKISREEHSTSPLQSSSDTSVLPEKPYAIKAGERANIRTRVEDILSVSISDLVDRATLTQSEHVGTTRSETKKVLEPDLEVESTSNGLNGGLNVKTGKLEEIEETKMDDLQKMLVQMEIAAAGALSSRKD